MATELALVPPQVVHVCRSFLTLAERVEWCDQQQQQQRLGGDDDIRVHSELRLWLHEVCRPSAFEIDTLVRDANGSDALGDAESSAQHVDVYQSPPLLRLILSNDALASIRFAKVSLAEALRRFERQSALSSTAEREWDAVVEIMKHVQELPSDDRARSYVQVSKMEHRVSELLDSFPVDASLYPAESYPDLLHAACTTGHAAMVVQLLETGMRPLFEQGGESLTCAVRYNHLDVVQQLDAAGQIPTGGAVIVNGLRLACARGSISMVDALLAHYSSSSNAWDHHPTLLRSAVQSDSLQVVKLLLECDPRGAFIRMNQLIAQLEREMRSDASQTPRLDAIIGKHGYFAWDLSAFEAAVRSNDIVLFDLLVNHIEWNCDELDAALATARANANDHMAKVIALLLQSIPDESDTSPAQPPVFAMGDKVEARKRGRATFSSAVIDRCWLNGTYDVAFSDDTDGTDDDNHDRGDERGASRSSSSNALTPKVERELHSQMIRYRSARNMGRIDTSVQARGGGGGSNVDEGVVQARSSASGHDRQQNERASESNSAESLRRIDDANVSTNGEHATSSRDVDGGLYDATASPLSGNDDDDDDDDDREIRADATIMRQQALKLSPGLSKLLDDLKDDIESHSASEPPLSNSSLSSAENINALLALQPVPPSSQLQLLSITDEHARERERCRLEEGDVVEAQCRGSSAFFPAKVLFCHTNELYDLEYDDGELDTLVPRAAIRFVLSEARRECTREAACSESPSISAKDGTEGEAVVTPASADRADKCASSSDLVDGRRVDTASTSHELSTDRRSSKSLFALGDAVEANFLGMGKFHRGRVVRLHEDDCSYDVQYVEFEETEARVAASCIRAHGTSKSAAKHASAVSTRGGSSSASRAPLAASIPRSVSRTSTRGSTSSSLSSSSRHDTATIAVYSETLVVPLLPSVVAASAKRASHKPARALTTMPVTSARATPEKSVATTRTTTSRRSSSNNARSTTISWRELEEWRNVDLILNRKRRFLNAQSGSIESSKVPWGEEFAAIQSLKRFSAQHPDILREYISSQLEGIGAANRAGGDQSARGTPSLSTAAASQAREALLLVKDLSFLLQQRLTPFLDVILPAVLPAVFNAEKRFLCDTAYEVLEALVLHCSGRRLAMMLLQFGDECAKRGDIRMLNLTSVYVEKCFANLNAAEIDALLARPSAAVIVTALASLLVCKSAPSKIAAQKSLSLIHAALPDAAFERVIRTLLPDELAGVVLRHTVFSTSSSYVGAESGHGSPTRSPTKGVASPVVVHQGMSILQRMVVQRQNRVVPAPE